jgi:hypothetical protein
MGISEILCLLCIGLGWPILLFTYLPDDDDDNAYDDSCSSKKRSVRFEVLTAVIIRILILREMVPCSLVSKCRPFGGSKQRLEMETARYSEH